MRNLLFASLVIAAGCGDGGGGGGDTGTSMDSGGGGGDSGGAIDSGAAPDSGGGDVDAQTGIDASVACGEMTPGSCGGGLECLDCPAGPIMVHYLCTTACESPADCTDPERPTCDQEVTAGGASPGLCVPADMSFRCSWGVRCASPDTAIATPFGERAIADLQVGDLVYGEDHGALRAVPIREVVRTPVLDHRVVRVELATGRVLEISPGHPTADGRFFADLRAGDTLDGIPIVSAELVPYVHAFTHDILPDSDTGTYVAGGALIGSTLAN